MRENIPPDRPALTDPHGTLTYAELAERVSGKAAEIAAMGIPEGHLIGVIADHSTNSVITVLGALAAGMPFFPLVDENTVPDRVAPILAAVAGTGPGAGTFPGGGPIPDDRPAYVIATSGSSGEPKETVVTRGGLRAVFGALRHRLDGVLPDGARWTHTHPLTFGYSMCEILGCLTFGGELLVGVTEGAQVRCLTPSELALLAARGEALPSHVVLSGEPAHKAPLRAVFDLPGGGEVTIINTYAATETSGQVAVHVVTGQTAQAAVDGLVGAVLPGVDVTIRRPDGTVVTGHGETGEIHVGGPVVAQGYLDPVLTAARFRDGTFATGDLGQWSAQGLHVVGRASRTVKVAGQWVALDEVERRVMAAGVAEAVVLADRLDGHDCLHVVAVPRRRGEDARLRARIVREIGLRATVRLTLVPALPRLPSGKVYPAIAVRTGEPRGVREVWEHALGSGVATDVNLFELGVDSLGLVAVAARLTAVLGRPVTPEFLLDHPRIDLQIAALQGTSAPAARSTTTRGLRGDRLRQARALQRNGNAR